jgi:hypothetical protein
MSFIAVGNNELGEPVGDTFECPHCREEHPVEYATKIEPDGTHTPSKFLGFYRCKGQTYLCAISGRRIDRAQNNRVE